MFTGSGVYLDFFILKAHVGSLDFRIVSSKDKEAMGGLLNKCVEGPWQPRGFAAFRRPCVVLRRSILVQTCSFLTFCKETCKISFFLPLDYYLACINKTLIV